MYRRFLLGLLLLWVALYYATPHPEAPCWTATHPNEGYEELVTASLEVVQTKFPEWYNAETSVGVDLEDERNLAYAHPIDEEGTIGIKITQGGLNICTAADLGAVLLHEYVHVKRWDAIIAMYPDEPCNTVRHEIEANWEVLAGYDKLGYSPKALGQALDLYKVHYIEGIILCPRSVYKDYPTPRGVMLWSY